MTSSDEEGVRSGRRGQAGRMNLPPGALARNTGFLISKVAQLGRERFERALEPMGLRARHYGVLTALAHEGPGTQRDLGEKLAIDRSTMVGLVDELERLGLVERRRDPHDRRRYELTLTDAGRRAVSEAESLADAVQGSVLAPLDEARRRWLHEALTSVLRNLEDAPLDEAGRKDGQTSTPS